MRGVKGFEVGGGLPKEGKKRMQHVFKICVSSVVHTAAEKEMGRLFGCNTKRLS